MECSFVSGYPFNAPKVYLSVSGGGGGGGGGAGGRLFSGMYGFVLVCLSSGAYGLLWVGTIITKKQRIKTEVFRYFEWTSRSSRDLLSLVGVSIFEVVFVPGCVRDRMWVL